MAQVCVVLPTYNRARCLARAVRSVLRQTFTDWELRVVDDGSTDETRSLIEELKRESSKILYTHQENRGVSAARNYAIFSTQAPWIACLDSDDEWHIAKLETQLQFANLYPQYRLIHSEEIWLRNGERIPVKGKHQKSGGRIFKRCLPLCCISPSTVMIRTDLIKTLGGFREDFPVCEDYDLWLKICAREEVGYISEPLITKYGGHEDQLSNRKAMDEFRAQALWEMRSHPALLPDEREALEGELLKKCRILIKGFRKYRNETRAQYWQAIQDHLLIDAFTHSPTTVLFDDEIG